MPKTLAQKAADKQLEEAVLRAIEAYKLLPPRHSMIEFVVAIEGMNIALDEDADDCDKESLGLAFRNGVVRSSCARGLLQMASDALRHGAWVNSEEND